MEIDFIENGDEEMIGIILTVLIMALAFKVFGFVLKICGKLLGGILSVIGYVLIGIFAVAVLGLATFVIPIVIIVGLAATIGCIVAKAK